MFEVKKEKNPPSVKKHSKEKILIVQVVFSNGFLSAPAQSWLFLIPCDEGWCNCSRVDFPASWAESSVFEEKNIARVVSWRRINDGSVKILSDLFSAFCRLHISLSKNVSRKRLTSWKFDVSMKIQWSTLF